MNEFNKLMYQESQDGVLNWEEVGVPLSHPLDGRRKKKKPL